jgi:hypothetical protein
MKTPLRLQHDKLWDDNDGSDKTDAAFHGKDYLYGYEGNERLDGRAVLIAVGLAMNHAFFTTRNMT